MVLDEVNAGRCSVLTRTFQVVRVPWNSQGTIVRFPVYDDGIPLSDLSSARRMDARERTVRAS